MNNPEFEYLGPYKVERCLGRGGMGTVYKGVHARSGDVVAIKVIAGSIADEPRFRRRFTAEIETLKRLKHPHIVQLIGHGEERGLLFYAMEYVEGHSLHEHLRQHKKLPWNDVVQIGIETASALKHAHDIGIIHRDLKPANLMLNMKAQVKLTDFGIAKFFGAGDNTGAAMIGTADYMPPEQAEGKAVTNRSDLYSLGGVMYALLAGKPPFAGRSIPEVLYALRFNPLPNLEDKAPDTPTELVQVINELLEKEPSKRPPTALVVGNRLKAIQQGLSRLQKDKPSPNDETDKKPSTPKIGKELTSLDLSDEEDDDLRPTNGDAIPLTNAEPINIRELPTQLAAHEHTQHLQTKSGNSHVTFHSSPAEEVDQTSPPAPIADATPDPIAAPIPDEKPPAPIPDVKPSVNPVPNLVASSAPPAQDNSNPAASSYPSSAGMTSGGPSHYTVIEGDTRTFTLGSDPAEEPKFDWMHYGSILGMIAVLLISIVFGWWMLRPSTADQLYERIMTSVETGNELDLLAAREDIKEFADRFPEDERVLELKSIDDEAELARVNRNLVRRAAKSGGSDSLSPIEQAFLDCMKARETNFQLAQKKLDAFLRVFGILENLPKSDQRLVELARFAEQTSEPKNLTSPAAAELEAAIRAAEKSLAPDRLGDYYRSVLILYGEKPWAAELLTRVRANLAKVNGK